MKDQYLKQDRGDRLRPHKSNPRYWTLTLLRRALEQIVESSALEPGATVLDYGCGNRPYEPLFRGKFNSFLGADFPGNDLADITIGPAGTLPLADESIDCVLSTQVLEHVESPTQYLDEAYRVLAPSGSLILSTHGIFRYHPDPTDYWRWTIDGLRRQITTGGFDIWRTYSVLGLASSAVRLWQDSTAPKIPLPLRNGYIRLLQCLIGMIEAHSSERVSNNGSIYVVFAKKRAIKNLPLAEKDDYRRDLAARDAGAAIPPNACVILVDQDEVGSSLLPGRKTTPFLERGGQYWGPPATDAEARREFERLYRDGAEFIVFAWPAFWWLDHYARFTRQLRSRFRCVLDNDRLVVFNLRAGPSAHTHGGDGRAPSTSGRSPI